MIQVACIILIVKLNLKLQCDAYILVKGTISIKGVAAAVEDNDGKELVFNNYWLHKWNKQYTNR